MSFDCEDASTLLSLPEELQDRIAAFLSPQDLFHGTLLTAKAFTEYPWRSEHNFREQFLSIYTVHTRSNHPLGFQQEHGLFLSYFKFSWEYLWRAMMFPCFFAWTHHDGSTMMKYHQSQRATGGKIVVIRSKYIEFVLERDDLMFGERNKQDPNEARPALHHHTQQAGNHHLLQQRRLTALTSTTPLDQIPSVLSPKYTDSVLKPLGDPAFHNDVNAQVMQMYVNPCGSDCGCHELYTPRIDEEGLIEFQCLIDGLLVKRELMMIDGTVHGDVCAFCSCQFVSYPKEIQCGACQKLDYDRMNGFLEEDDYSDELEMEMQIEDELEFADQDAYSIYELFTRAQLIPVM